MKVLSTPGLKLLYLNGPVPSGFFGSKSRGTIVKYTDESISGRTANGCEYFSTTVVGLPTFDDGRSIGPRLDAPGYLLDTIRLKLYSTSSAVNGLPRCVVTPSGITIVHSVPSLFGVIDLAID